MWGRKEGWLLKKTLDRKDLNLIRQYSPISESTKGTPKHIILAMQICRKENSIIFLSPSSLLHSYRWDWAWADSSSWAMVSCLVEIDSLWDLFLILANKPFKNIELRSL